MVGSEAAITAQVAAAMSEKSAMVAEVMTGSKAAKEPDRRTIIWGIVV